MTRIIDLISDMALSLKTTTRFNSALSSMRSSEEDSADSPMLEQSTADDTADDHERF